MEPKNTKRSFFAEWLEKLQQESWQLELLISGFAIFGIWEAMKLVGRLYQRLDGATQFKTTLGSTSDFMLSTVEIGLTIILINFLVHVTLRSLWIGAIGLRYVSGDIDYEKLKYSSRFTSFYQKSIGSFDKYIERLENWCSVVFAYTFVVVGIFVSLACYTLGFVLITELLLVDAIRNDELDWRVLVWGFVILLYLGLGLIVFLDFITMGLLRKIEDKTISAIYLFIYRVFGILTLSFVYRPLLLNFLDTKFTKRLFFFSIPYALAIALILPNLHIQTFTHFPDTGYTADYMLHPVYYDDLRNEMHQQSLESDPDRKRINIFSFNKHIITEPYGKVFFPMDVRDGEFMSDMKNIDAMMKTGLRINQNEARDSLAESTKDSLQLVIKEFRRAHRDWRSDGPHTDSIEVEARYASRMDSLMSLTERTPRDIRLAKVKDVSDAFLSLIGFEIDSIDFMDSMSCKYYVHPNLGERGMLCIFPTGSLEDGEHKVRVTRRFYRKASDEPLNDRHWRVPLWTYRDNY